MVGAGRRRVDGRLLRGCIAALESGDYITVSAAGSKNRGQARFNVTHFDYGDDEDA